MQTIKSRQESPQRKWRDDPQLWNLRRACLRNSLDLLKEARILYKHQHYPRVFALVHMAYEEFGKAHIVADYITGIVSEEEFWLAFRSHDLKGSYNKRKIVIEFGKVDPPTVVYDKTTAKQLFKLRMDSLYVDCSPDYSPSVPKEVITSKVAKDALKQVETHIARILWIERFTERIGTEALAK